MNFCFAKFVFNLSARSNFVKQLFRIQIQKGGKILPWSQVKSRIDACYSELILFRALNGFQVMILRGWGGGRGSSKVGGVGG